MNDEEALRKLDEERPAAEPSPVPAPEPNESHRMPVPGRPMLTFVLQVYYQPERGEGQGVSVQYEQILDAEEEVYSRKMPVDETWRRLDTGWLEQASLVVLQAPADLTIWCYAGTICPREVLVGDIMTLEKTSPDQSQINALRPGTGTSFVPSSLRDIWLRAAEGKGRCQVTIFPR